MPTSAPSTDDQDHVPGRSGTPTAWITLAVVAFLLTVGIFFEPLFCGILRVGLSTACWMRGDRLEIGGLSLAGNRRLVATQVDLTFGNRAHRSHWTSELVELRPPALRGLAARLFTRHGARPLPWIGELQVGRSTLLVDTRGGDAAAKTSVEKAPSLPLFPWSAALPVAFSGGPIDLVVIGASYRVGIQGMTAQFPDRWPGTLSYDAATLDLGTWHRDFPKAAAAARWDGSSLSLDVLPLGKGLKLEELTLAIRDGRLEFGWRGRVGKGRLLGDGSLGATGSRAPLEGILIAENVPLELLAGVVSEEEKRAAGTIRQGRLTFRGDPAKPLEADASLRLLADAVRWEGLGWDSLRLAATLTGRTLTLSELTLRQNENEVEAEGQSRLPGEWRAVMRAPFSATFRASLADAGSLASLGGPAFSQLSGSLFLEGSIKGADNKAEGYCNLEGFGMTVRQLPVDWLKGCLFFEGTKTQVGYFEAVSAEDRISLRGTMENSNPHAYEGTAELSLRNVAGTLAQLGLQPDAAFGSGTVRGSWSGTGSATGHSGSFEAKVADWVGPRTKRGMTGAFEGTYAPGRLELAKGELLQENLRLGLKLAATPARLEVSSISAVRTGTTTPLLAGDLSLPLNVFRAWNSGGLLGNLGMNESLAAHLRFRGIRAEDLADLLGQNIACTGSLEGEVNASGTPEMPEIQSSLRVARFTPDGTGSPVGMQVRLDAAKGRAAIQLLQEPAAHSPLLLSGEIPFRWALENNRLRCSDASAPVKGAAVFRRVPADGWATLFGKGRGLLRGTLLDGDLSLEGSLEKPAVAGSLRLEAREATLPGTCVLRNLLLPVGFSSGSATVAAGSARFGGSPVMLDGTLDLSSLEGWLTLKGRNVTFPSLAGTETRGDADLRITARGADAPEFGGVLTVRTVSTRLNARCTPFFVPPAIALPAEPTASPGAVPSCWDAAKLNLTVKTEGDLPMCGTSPREAPLLHGVFSVKGTVGNPLAEGEASVSNATLEFPAGRFFVPGARLQLSPGGQPALEAVAYGVTGLGLSTVRLTGSAVHPALLLEGPSGVTAADAVLALATPIRRSGGTPPLRQEAAWLRQQELFSIPSVAWATAKLGGIDSAGLGFYGTPWSCALERVTAPPALPKR